MATVIAATPTLRGKEADDFEKKANENLTKCADRKTVLRALKTFEGVAKNGGWFKKKEDTFKESTIMDKYFESVAHKVHWYFTAFFGGDVPMRHVFALESNDDWEENFCEMIEQSIGNPEAIQ